MERRTFLKVSSVAVAAFAGQLASPWSARAAGKDVAYGGLLYRAGGSGRVLTSSDHGKSWTLHSDLGDIFSITDIAVDRRSRRLRLTVDYSGYPFVLFLGADAGSWVTF